MHPTYVYGLLDYSEYVVTFKAPYGYLISQLFLLSFLVGLLLSPTTIHCFGQFNSCSKIQQLPLIVFDKCPTRLLGLSKLRVRSNKYCLLNGVSLRTTGKSNNDNSLRMGLWRYSNPMLPLSISARLWFSLSLCCRFQRLLKAEKRRIGLNYVKMP